MPATVILNPYANRWRTDSQRPAIEAALRQAGIEFNLHRTDGPKHAQALAQAAVAANALPVIAAGGDGTINEVLNGLMDAGYNGPLGVIPAGTANDMPDTLGIPRDFTQAAQVIAAGHTRTVDLGRVNGHWFVNNAAIGLEALVTTRNEQYVWAHTVARYLIAALVTVFVHPRWHMTLTGDIDYASAAGLVSFGNCERTGGVFLMTPHAVPDDGHLDVTLLRGSPSVWRLLQLLPRTIKGTHLDAPEVSYHHVRQLTITVEPPTPIQADGELLPWATTVELSFAPHAFSIFVPPK